MNNRKYDVFNLLFMNFQIFCFSFTLKVLRVIFFFGESPQIVLYVLIMSLHFFPVATDRTAMTFTFPLPLFLFSIWPMEMIHKDINNMLGKPIQQCKARFSKLVFLYVALCCVFWYRLPWFCKNFNCQTNVNTKNTSRNPLDLEINVYVREFWSIHIAE